MEATADRVDRLDPALYGLIQPGWTQTQDLRSLLALHAMVAERLREFTFLEVGSYLGRSLQAFVADPRCTRIVSIDTRDRESPDERGGSFAYEQNTTENMLRQLSSVPGADLSKIVSLDTGTDGLDAADFQADLCFVDAEHTHQAVLRDARFCRRAIRDRGVIAFHDRTVLERGLAAFLRELPRYRAYPLASEMFVVEIGVPPLLSDARVRGQVPRREWLWLERAGAMRLALLAAASARRLTRRGS